jgi:hypothetical protein
VATSVVKVHVQICFTKQHVAADHPLANLDELLGYLDEFKTEAAAFSPQMLDRFVSSSLEEYIYSRSDPRRRLRVMTVTIPSDDIPIYVLGTDRNLWLETGPFKQDGPIPPGRTPVVANVLDFDPIDENNVYVLDTDRNLSLISAPFGTVPPPQPTPIDGNVVGFDGLNANGTPLRFNSKLAIYVLRTNGELWLIRFEE